MLKDKIESGIKEALRAREELRLSVLRMLSSAIHNKEIEKRARLGGGTVQGLDDEEVIQAIRSELKKRKDAEEAYGKGGRAEAAKKEKTEAEILSAFLPREISDEELDEIISQAASALGKVSEKEFGKFMAWVMGRVKGRASGDRVAAAVKKKLGRA